MKPDISQWQSGAAYDYIVRLDVAGVAWEWLRRNRDYQADFARYLGTASSVLRGRLANTIAARWGIRFPDPAWANRSHKDRLLDPGRRHRRAHRRPIARPSEAP
ncbi:transcriptional regulator domain-containing protein [Bosea sp. MMO-172]|uniref:transcriptional regulator domain-containing protein n=1 Tax=Bosea sp. MMO-172 TaxID=3127885 RepID=UPI003FA52832